MPQWFTRHGWQLFIVLGLISVLAIAAACGGDDDDDDGGGDDGGGGKSEALKIGVLSSFTGDLSDFGEPIFNGAQLAADEINAAGGVLGQDVQLVRGDDGTNPDQGVTEARRLVDVEGVQAMVGALASGVSLQVAETVTGPAGVPQISPASTSPGLSDANDDDFLFRTTISDAGQGLLLAQLADQEGLTNVCTMYINSAYGEGLSNAFAAAFKDLGGTVVAEVPHEGEAASYATELGQCEGADALAAMSYPETAGIYLREAVEGEMFPNYLFVDGTKSSDMVEQLGWDAFDGAKGTAPSSLPTDQVGPFEERYQAAYGELPPLPFIKEAYDAVYLIALAAVAADSTNGADIRDSLRDVANAEGTTVNPGEDGFAAALTALGNGDDVNYEGVSGPIEFDDKGDPQVGAIEYWHIDAANKELVTDKVFRVDFASGEVTDITEEATGGG